MMLLSPKFVEEMLVVYRATRYTMPTISSPCPKSKEKIREEARKELLKHMRKG
jgi:hypothetical protein